VLRKLIVAVLGLGATLGVWALAAAPANAQGTANEQVIPTVFNESLDSAGKTVREPVPGVRITVTTKDGAAVGEGVTGADGSVKIDLPGPGDYVIAIDESSLPANAQVTPDTKTPRALTVNPSAKSRASFFLGKDTRKTESKLELLPQALFTGIKLSAIIAMCAMGLSMIYGTTGLSNFAHGEIVTLGALMAWVANQRWGWHIFLAMFVGIAAAAVAGGLLERGLWRPMRTRRSSLTSMMIVSIGLALGVRYLFQFFYGARSHPYRQFQVQKEWDLGPFSANPRQLLIIAACAVSVILTCFFLLRTRFGKAIRAVSDNPELASTTGIDTDRVILAVWMLGGALAGLGGVLFGLEFRVQWDMGNTLLLLMFAAITLGGLGNPFGALLGSVIIGVFVELWGWALPAELKTVGALAALIVLLLIRPQGILGRKERIG
jgi:branched-chain amino acid transport system permease protein